MEIYAALIASGSPPKSAFVFVKAQSPDQAMSAFEASLQSDEETSGKVLAVFSAQEIAQLHEHLSSLSKG